MIVLERLDGRPAPERGRLAGLPLRRLLHRRVRPRGGADAAARLGPERAGRGALRRVRLPCLDGARRPARGAARRRARERRDHPPEPPRRRRRLARRSPGSPGYLLAWRFTRRIRRLEAAAERLADGDFETPVVDTGRDEVGQLADAFDGMRVRLAVLDRARGEFIANASHELRTPLFSLGGFVELLDDEEHGPSVRREFLAEMRDQIDRLTRLATDLLDLSRLDAGQLEVEIAPFDLAATARLVADEFRPGGGVGRARAARRGRRAGAGARRRAARAADRPRPRRERDPAHAGRHDGDGARSCAAATARVLEVRDDGPGIPPEDQKHLFQRFYRAAGGKASGSGLGLAIASELASPPGRLDRGLLAARRHRFHGEPAARPGRSRAEPKLVADVAS